MAWSLSLFYGPKNNRLFEHGQRWTATLSADYTSGTTLSITGFNSYSGQIYQLPDHLKVNDYIEIGPSTNASYIGVSERKRVVSATATTITIDSALDADYESGDSVTGIGMGLPEYWKKYWDTGGEYELTSWGNYRGAIYYPLSSLDLNTMTRDSLGQLGRFRDTGFGARYNITLPLDPGTQLFMSELDSALALLSSSAIFGVSVYSRNWSTSGNHTILLNLATQSTSYTISHGISAANHTTWTQYTGTYAVNWSGTTLQYLYLGINPVSNDQTLAIFSDPTVYSLTPISGGASYTMTNNPNFGSIWHEVRSKPGMQVTSGGAYIMSSETSVERFSVGASFFTTYTDYEQVLRIYNMSRRGQAIVLFHDIDEIPNPIVGAMELGKVTESHWDRTRCNFEFAVYET